MDVERDDRVQVTPAVESVAESSAPPTAAPAKRGRVWDSADYVRHLRAEAIAAGEDPAEYDARHAQAVERMMAAVSLNPMPHDVAEQLLADIEASRSERE